MYIRCITTHRLANGQAYYSFRLVESRREDGKVRQRTVLNLGSRFDVATEQWPMLCARLDQLLNAQDSLAPIALAAEVERIAQNIVAQLIIGKPDQSATANFVEVDVTSLNLIAPKAVGVEHVAVHALEQLRMLDYLASLGIPSLTCSMIAAQIIGRMAAPGSERATWQWLDERSALPELLDISLAGMSMQRLYRSADTLLTYRDEIETYLFGQAKDLLGFNETVTLYDLTNTYFEGAAEDMPHAQHGRSKEKRSDCRLLTLALVLDGSGFVRRSRVLAGNAAESLTLQAMLTDLNVAAGAMVIMDAGIATEANIAWLRAQGYRYLVVSRERNRIAPQGDVYLSAASGAPIQVERVVDDSGEVRLYCHSSGRERKETGMNQRFCDRFEQGLRKLADGLSQPRAHKRPETIHTRIGRLIQASRGVGQHYHIDVQCNDANTQVLSINWSKQALTASRMTHPGVYCLRSNETGWDAEQLWRTYSTLTDLEAVFRSMKSELGLRPIYHFTAGRADAHLFITVLAYQCVQLIRHQLKQHGIHESWQSLRDTLSVQRRVTAQFKQRDGRTLNVRKATQPEVRLTAIYKALGIDPLPGGTKKHIA